MPSSCLSWVKSWRNILTNVGGDGLSLTSCFPLCEYDARANAVVLLHLFVIPVFVFSCSARVYLLYTNLDDKPIIVVLYMELSLAAAHDIARCRPLITFFPFDITWLPMSFSLLLLFALLPLLRMFLGGAGDFVSWLTTPIGTCFGWADFKADLSGFGVAADLFVLRGIKDNLPFLTLGSSTTLLGVVAVGIVRIGNSNGGKLG